MTEPFTPDYHTGTPLPDWQGASAPSRATMQGRFCRLEPTSLDHVPDLSATFQSGDAATDWLYLGYGPFATEREVAAWVSKVCLGEDPLFFTIVDPAAEQAVGVASYLNIHAAMGSIEVGHIHFSPAIQRSRIATEAMYLMMAHAFDQGFRRYEWKCDSLNQRSRRAAQRFGFSYEGIFRQHLITKGRNRDTAWYAMIDAEWPALKAAYQTWLSDSNFQADGTQRQSLADLTGPVLVARG